MKRIFPLMLLLVGVLVPCDGCTPIRTVTSSSGGQKQTSTQLFSIVPLWTWSEPDDKDVLIEKLDKLSEKVDALSQRIDALSKEAPDSEGDSGNRTSKSEKTATDSQGKGE